VVQAQTIPLDPDDVGEELITLPAEAAPADDGLNASFTLYGQFNPVYQSFDDGGESTAGLVDNGNWNSRIGFRVEQPMDNATLRLRFETGFGFRNSAAVSQLSKPGAWSFNRRFLRWFEAAVDTDYGTLSLGQGSMASDGAAGLDASFTFVAGATDSSDGFGAFRFRDSDGNLTGVSVGAVNSAINGARRFRIRYDTPAFNGFVVSASYGQNVLVETDDAEVYDLALRWNGDAGDFTIQTALAYAEEVEPVAPDRQRLSGSATLFHNPTGLNLNVSAGSLRDGPQYAWVRAGWRTDIFAAGTTSFSIDYYKGSDFLSVGSETENYGIYAVQSFDDISLDAYVGIRRFSFGDRSGTAYQDATGLLIGARWFF
jgi:predicted porin